MLLSELEERTDALLDQIARRMGGKYDKKSWTVDVMPVGAGAYAVPNSGGVLNRLEAQQMIERLGRFYAAATDDEIAFLNQLVLECRHCNEYRTLDEFFKVESVPSRATVLEAPNGEMYGIYCRTCHPAVRLQAGTGRQYVYLATSTLGYKIGLSANPAARIEALRAEYGVDFTLLHMVRTTRAPFDEQHAHSMFAHRHITRELFALSTQDVAQFCTW